MTGSLRIGARMAAGLVLAVVFATLTAPLWLAWLGVDATSVDASERYAPMSSQHWLGTDALGRDVLARLVLGTRLSLVVAITATAFAVPIGAALGVWAGYRGGWGDALFMRLTDGLRAIPRLPLMIVLLAIDVKKLGFEPGGGAAVLQLVLIVALLGWTTVGRLGRATALALREREFVLAARALGLPERRVLWAHVLPHALTPIIVTAALMLGEVILYESVLSYLGLGVQPPTPSLGAMLRNGLSHLHRAPHLTVLPGLVAFALVVAFNILGDGLRDALDPRFSRASGVGETAGSG